MQTILNELSILCKCKHLKKTNTQTDFSRNPFGAGGRDMSLAIRLGTCASTPYAAYTFSDSVSPGDMTVARCFHNVAHLRHYASA